MKRPIPLSLRLASALALGGNGVLGAFNALQAGRHRPAVVDLAYGEQARQALDLYLPSEDLWPAPLLVWFYGGSWSSGSKSLYTFVARRFNAMGYAVAIPDYRLVPQVRFPAFLHDGAGALRALADYAREHPQVLAAQPMVLAGHSAGAYNAVQLVADPRYLEAVGLSREDIAGIIGLSGPYDFHPYRVDATRMAFGDAPAFSSQPVARDLSLMPPLLLISGDSDTTVGPGNSVRLASLAPQAELRVIDGLDHVGTLIALGHHITAHPDVLEPVRAFLDALAVAREARSPEGLLSSACALAADRRDGESHQIGD